MFGWFNFFHSQSQGREILDRISELTPEEIKSVSTWDSNAGAEIKLSNFPSVLLVNLLNSFREADSALFTRSPEPNKKIFIRIDTTIGSYDFEFYFHKYERKDIKFNLIKRNYFGKNSYNQENFGSFKSDSLVNVLVYVVQNYQ